MALVATNSLLSSELTMGIISSLHPVIHYCAIVLFIANGQTFERQRWQQFLVYIGFILAAFLINVFLNKALPVVYRGACQYFLRFLKGY